MAYTPKHASCGLGASRIIRGPPDDHKMLYCGVRVVPAWRDTHTNALRCILQGASRRELGAMPQLARAFAVFARPWRCKTQSHTHHAPHLAARHTNTTHPKTTNTCYNTTTINTTASTSSSTSSPSTSASSSSSSSSSSPSSTSSSISRSHFG